MQITGKRYEIRMKKLLDRPEGEHHETHGSKLAWLFTGSRQRYWLITAGTVKLPVEYFITVKRE